MKTYDVSVPVCMTFSEEEINNEMKASNVSFDLAAKYLLAEWIDNNIDSCLESFVDITETV